MGEGKGKIRNNWFNYLSNFMFKNLSPLEKFIIVPGEPNVDESFESLKLLVFLSNAKQKPWEYNVTRDEWVEHKKYVDDDYVKYQKDFLDAYQEFLKIEKNTDVTSEVILYLLKQHDDHMECLIKEQEEKIENGVGDDGSVLCSVCGHFGEWCGNHPRTCLNCCEKGLGIVLSDY